LQNAELSTVIVQFRLLHLMRLMARNTCVLLWSSFCRSDMGGM